MSAAVAEAARAVEENSEALDSAEPVEGESRDRERAADPDLPDRGEEIPQEPVGIYERLAAPLEGSVKEDHVGELWNPEQGGLNRLVLVLEEAFGVGEGLPRIAHAGISVAEMAAKPPEAVTDLTGGEGEQEAEAEQKGAPVDKGDTREVMEV